MLILPTSEHQRRRRVRRVAYACVSGVSAVTTDETCIVLRPPRGRGRRSSPPRPVARSRPVSRTSRAPRYMYGVLHTWFAEDENARRVSIAYGLEI